MNLSDLGNPKYISLETFRSNGQPVKTPVWTVRRDDRLLVWTQGDSWKVRRARKNPRVRVAECDMRGNVKSQWVEGLVTSISDEPDTKKMMAGMLRKKYHWMVAFVSLVAILRRENTGQVVMEISDA